jgi:hypothetical protein
MAFNPNADDTVRAVTCAGGWQNSGRRRLHPHRLACTQPPGAPGKQRRTRYFLQPNLDGNVYALAVQPDGAVLAGGDFAHVGPVARNRLARLSSSGALDATFAPSPNGSVHAIVVLDDGKLLVAGAFTQIGGQARPYLARLKQRRRHRDEL